MAKGVNVTCPNCGKKNIVSFAQIKKNMKGAIPIALACGCRCPPDQILDQAAKIAAEALRKMQARFPK